VCISMPCSSHPAWLVEQPSTCHIKAAAAAGAHTPALCIHVAAGPALWPTWHAGMSPSVALLLYSVKAGGRARAVGGMAVSGDVDCWCLCVDQM
jgi:hypothetical protein